MVSLFTDQFSSTTMVIHSAVATNDRTSRTNQLRWLSSRYPGKRQQPQRDPRDSHVHSHYWAHCSPLIQFDTVRHSYYLFSPTCSTTPQFLLPPLASHAHHHHLYSEGQPGTTFEDPIYCFYYWLRFVAPLWGHVHWSWWQIPRILTCSGNIVPIKQPLINGLRVIKVGGFCIT